MGVPGLPFHCSFLSPPSPSAASVDFSIWQQDKRCSCVFTVLPAPCFLNSQGWSPHEVPRPPRSSRVVLTGRQSGKPTHRRCLDSAPPRSQVPCFFLGPPHGLIFPKWGDPYSSYPGPAEEDLCPFLTSRAPGKQGLVLGRKGTETLSGLGKSLEILLQSLWTSTSLD